MSIFRGCFKVVGRMLLSVIFLLSALNKIMNWRGSEEYLSAALGKAMAAYKDVSWLHEVLSGMASWVGLLIIMAVFLELVGGLCLFLSFKPRFGAFLLILFLIPTTFIFHNFWTMSGADRGVEMTTFLRNLSIIGGLLIVLSSKGGCGCGGKCGCCGPKRGEVSGPPQKGK